MKVMVLYGFRGINSTTTLVYHFIETVNPCKVLDQILVSNKWLV